MNEATDYKKPAADSILSKIELPKIIDLIVSKQTQYYTLWAVYTAVQFAAGSYGYGHPVPWEIALAVVSGVWAFNVGHLGFVLRCKNQINMLGNALRAALDEDHEKYQSTLRNIFIDIGEVSLSWSLYKQAFHETYRWNTCVHLFIDICASLALLTRAVSNG
jgi:hypothetical protein